MVDSVQFAQLVLNDPDAAAELAARSGMALPQEDGDMAAIAGGLAASGLAGAGGAGAAGAGAGAGGILANPAFQQALAGLAPSVLGGGQNASLIGGARPVSAAGLSPLIQLLLQNAQQGQPQPQQVPFGALIRGA